MNNVLNFVYSDCEVLEVLDNSFIVEIPLMKSKKQIEEENNGRYVKTEDFFKINTPLFIWVLPLIFIILSLFDIIKKTNAKSKPKP